MTRHALLYLALVMTTALAACEEYEAPTYLEETGLYAEPEDQVLADDVIFYQPRFVLWSDTAEKRRFIQLPRGKKIDTSNPDFWRFPQGTKLWKEFWRDGKRVETRLIWKAGTSDSDPEDWIMISYVWNEEQTEAVRTPDGLQDGLGTEHDVPDTGQCFFCHGNTPGRVLSFSAVQLNHDLEGLNLEQANEMGIFTDPVDTSFTVPGEPHEQAALGYLHANCGMCHNPNGDTGELEMDLWLRTDSPATVEETNTYQSTVRVQGTTNGGSFGLRLVQPGRPEDSGIVVRMRRRGVNKGQMPPVGTEVVDPSGLDTIVTWISNLR